MVPQRVGLRAPVRRNELQQWCGFAGQTGPLGARAGLAGNAYGTTAQSRGTTRLGTTEIVPDTGGHSGHSSGSIKPGGCENGHTRLDDGNSRSDDSQYQNDERRPRHPRKHDLTWTHGASNRGHDVDRIDVGHDHVVRSRELVANSFIVRQARP